MSLSLFTPDRMNSLGIVERQIKGQLANRDSPGKIAIKSSFACVVSKM